MTAKSLFQSIIALSVFTISCSAEVIEVFEDKDGFVPPKSGPYIWTANPGILSKGGKSVIQTHPNPKTMRIKLVHDLSSGQLVIASQGEKMTMHLLAKGDKLTWRSNQKTKALSVEEVAILAGKNKIEELPCWTGKHTNKEGVNVSYSLVQVMDELFIGQLVGKRGGMTFHRSFLLKPAKK